MTSKQHVYVDAVNQHCKGFEYVAVGPTTLCADCPEVDPDIGDEGHFSRSVCDSCGCHLHGMRYAAHGVEYVGLQDGDPAPLIHMDICPNCVQLHANGEVPE